MTIKSELAEISFRLCPPFGKITSQRWNLVLTDQTINSDNNKLERTLFFMIIAIPTSRTCCTRRQWLPSFPRQGLVFKRSTSKSNWNLEVEGEKTLGPRREPTTNSTHTRRRVRESNLGHRDGRRALAYTTAPHVLP